MRSEMLPAQTGPAMPSFADYLNALKGIDCGVSYRHTPRPPTPQFGIPQDEEGCTRKCIQELQAAVLELLLQGFWERGLHCTAPPSPVGLCANPPPGRLPCAAP